ncbi:hypothetical protein N665_0922s0018 [Sinapis alba]|nr:hypothetical protein N665_0922s0018 [Sinapis alba]
MCSAEESSSSWALVKVAGDVLNLDVSVYLVSVSANFRGSLYLRGVCRLKVTAASGTLALTLVYKELTNSGSLVVYVCCCDHFSF